MSLPSPHLELPSQLLESIRHRDATATARLISQWVHRHGLTSLESFRTGRVIAQQGTEAGDWMLRQLEGASRAPSAPELGASNPPFAAAAYPDTSAAGMEDAFAALEAAFSAPPEFAGEAPASFELAPGVTSLPEASRLSVQPPGPSPAPAPSSLADLRSWLSGAPQHRRAS